MKNKIQILCYGDSNTWGCIGRWYESDAPSERYDEEHRWPCVLQKELGDSFNVIPEGLGGRTTIYDLDGEWRNGERYLKPCLLSHRPLDLVIILLGTNDLQKAVQPEEEDLGKGISRLIDLVRENPNAGRSAIAPKILIISPIGVEKSHPDGRVLVYDKFKGDIGRRKSLLFPSVYRIIAEEKGCYYLDATPYAKVGEADGVHFDAQSHINLGKAVAALIRDEIYPEK